MEARSGHPRAVRQPLGALRRLAMAMLVAVAALSAVGGAEGRTQLKTCGSSSTDACTFYKEDNGALTVDRAGGSQASCGGCRASFL